MTETHTRVIVVNGHALPFQNNARRPECNDRSYAIEFGHHPRMSRKSETGLSGGKKKALNMTFFSRKNSSRGDLEIGLIDQVSAPNQRINDVLEIARILSDRRPIALKFSLRF